MKDKKKENLRKGRQSEPDARLRETIDRPEEISMESTPVDEPTIDPDTKQAHIERMMMTWQTTRNANGKTRVLCESREQDPECAGKLCFACCDSTRIQNYKCSVCCESKKTRAGYTCEKRMELNETTISPSRTELVQNCGFYDGFGFGRAATLCTS
jgi:hypothetical protein